MTSPLDEFRETIAKRNVDSKLEIMSTEQRIAVALERIQKVQEYDTLRNWALKLSSYERQSVQGRMDRLAQLQKELWPDAL